MEFLLPALFSFLATSLSIYPTILIAKKFHLLDNPEKRIHPANTQKRIVPRAGGLACFLGIVLSMLIFLPIGGIVVGIIIALSLLLIVGLIDDKYKGLSPYIRLIVQILAALIIVGSGVGFNFITNPLGGIINFGPLTLTFDILNQKWTVAIADILAIIWIVWVMNMINWAKGVDGQMPGIITAAAFILGILSLKFLSLGDQSQLNVAKLALITGGSALSFLIFNWHPAKIFPGFSGSTIFGLLIATLSILSGAKLATAGLILLVPATDFIYTFLRRILQGKSPVWADRGHLHHRLLDLGFSHKKIALFYILGSVILGIVSLSLDSRGKLFAAILVSIIILGAILWLNFFGDYSRRQDPDSG